MNKLEVILDALDSVKLTNIETYDMRGKSPFYDFLIISSASNSRQLNASVSTVQKQLVEHNFDHAKVEGKESPSWILLDCKDVILNVFTEEERAFYNLEKTLIEIEKIRPEDLK